MLTKFELKADEGIFVGYPLSTKAFRVYNLRTKVIMESIHVSFDDKKIITGLDLFDTGNNLGVQHIAATCRRHNEHYRFALTIRQSQEIPRIA